MINQTLNPWRYLVVQPYSWLVGIYIDIEKTAEALPEKMTVGQYVVRALQLLVPFFSLLFPVLLVGAPIVAWWNDNPFPTPYPFMKVALVTAALEAVVLVGCGFFRTRMGFLIALAIGLPAAIGLGLGILG